MDTKKMGTFLAKLRREHNLTQEQLGEKLGVTNKTVSRWENGNYLPPAEMLQALSELYNVTINEILSGERLPEEAYREKAEENIATVLKQRSFSARERVAACLDWLARYWWVLLICLLPAAAIYVLMPHMVGSGGRAVELIFSLLLLGLNLGANHLVFYVNDRAYSVTGKQESYSAFKIIRVFWLVMIGVAAFAAADILGAFFYALTPAGTADGYAVNSLFYDILIEDHGNYLDNCYEAVRRTLWHLFQVCAINIELAILWIRKS